MKDWQLTLIGFIGLVIGSVLGGIAFHFLESDNEAKFASLATSQLNNYLADRTCINATEVLEIYNILQLVDRAGLRVGISTDYPIENITNWDLESAVFLSLQVIGSVGFGNAPPRTNGGRVFCVFYIICGIPLFFATALGVGELFEHWVDIARGSIHFRALGRLAPPKETRRARIINALTMFFAGGTLFIIIPSVIFYELESWTFFEAFYTAVVITLTIGFSDYIPGTTAPLSYRGPYRILVGIWILVDLFWFSAVMLTVRNIFEFAEEVRKPLDEAIAEDEAETSDSDDSDDQEEIQENKFGKKKPRNKYVNNNRRGMPPDLITPSLFIPAPISAVDVIPISAPNRLYPAIITSPVDNRLTVLAPVTSSINNVSRLTINNS